MELHAHGIVVLTALCVAFLAWFGGEFFAGSMILDEVADEYYERGYYEDAIEARDQAREAHDYFVYCMAGVVLVIIGGAVWAWKWEHGQITQPGAFWKTVGDLRK